MTEKSSKKVDKALDATFPASDPPAVGGATSTEEPRRPADREAPLPRKEDVEAAASKEQDGEAVRKRHRGVGREGLSRSDHVSPPGDDQGLGHEGALDEHPVAQTTREA